MFRITIDDSLVHSWLEKEHIRRLYAKSLYDSYNTPYDLKGEKWKTLVYNCSTGEIIKSSRYLLSNWGRVKNADTGIILRQTINKKLHYSYVTLHEPGHDAVLRSVHRLVGMTFIDNPDNLPIINHKCHGMLFKSFNHESNLEWTTIIDNTQYSLFAMRNKKAALTEDQLQEIKDIIIGMGNRKYTTRDIMKKLSFKTTDKTMKAVYSVLTKDSYKNKFDGVEFSSWTNNNVKFSDQDIDKIIKEIQLDGWSTTSVLGKLGYNKTDNPDMYEALKRVLKGQSYTDKLKGVKRGKRKTEYGPGTEIRLDTKRCKMANVIDDVCKDICKGMTKYDISKKYNVDRSSIYDIIKKSSYKDISDKYFTYDANTKSIIVL